MKNGLYKCLLAGFLFLTGNEGWGQSRYRFFTLGMDQGLTSDFVWSICQDKYNYMWIGTDNGLNRYDGHTIRPYFHDPADSFSLPGNRVYWMYRDTTGELWFSLGSQGVARYNYAKDRFEKFLPFDSIRKKNNYAAPLWRMGADAQQRIYFACGGACFRYSRASGKMEDLTPLFGGLIRDYGVAMFIPQGKQLLWILTDNGLFRYDLAGEQIRKIPFDKVNMGFGSEAMHDGEFVNEHEMLISVVRGAFVLFDTRTETFRKPPPPLDPTVSKIYSETGGVLKDSKGRIWLANSRYGLLEYFPSGNTTSPLKNERSYPYPYPEQEGSGMNVYEDNSGNIWYGSSRKGVIWFNPGTDFIQVFERDYAREQTLPDNTVTCFLPLDKNRMLIGTNNGIAGFDTRYNEFRNFPVARDDKDPFPHPLVRSMDQSGDSVFITTYRGLSIYHQNTNRFSRYIPALRSDSVFPFGQWGLHRTGPGRLFISGGQLIEFDLGTKSYIYPAANETISGLLAISATHYHKPTQTLWLGAGKAQLYSYNHATRATAQHTFTRDTALTSIDAISADGKGRLWLGTTRGLYCYDPITRNSRKQELPLSSPGINNIVPGNNQLIWMSTNVEIIQYDPVKDSAVILPVHALFPNSRVMKGALFFDSGGFLWVGTNKGFGKIDTRRFGSARTDKAPELVRFSVFDQARLFDRPLAGLAGIDLKYTENFFSFQLSAFNFHTPNAVKYSYFLEGFDKDWHPAQNNTGSYTNVPPGTYRLRVRSSSETGGWTEKMNPLTIHIRAPFWQTGWFIALVSLVVAALLFGLFRLLQNRKRKALADAAIQYFANSQYGENTVTELCWDITRHCIAQLQLEDCVLYLLDEEKNRLLQVASHAAKNPRDPEIIMPPEIEPGKGIVGTAAKNARPLLIRDTRKYHRYDPGDTRPWSELAVPIIHEGKTIGVIDSKHSTPGFFTKQHIRALTTIAAISASKIAEARAEETARAAEMKLLEIKKLLAESQLMALRAQMNPHFVFNCLNSVQECILTENYVEASLYLNKFSRLFRSVLNNSGKELITLSEEMDVLEMYLSLEHMRFEKSFDYRVLADEDLEKDEILIPSMLLQPYVENALWHGLMHKKGDRLLTVSFRRISEDLFQCTVDDNGIGREKAMELKKQQGNSKQHVSRGMGISKDRIDLLRKQGQHAVLQITDKYDANNEAAGTKVMIELSAYLNE